MIIKIEFENTKITLSVGAEGVVLDAPVVMDEETRQTTLRDAQWAAYAKGRADERAAIQDRLVDFSEVEIVDQTERPRTGYDLPAFDDLQEITCAVEDVEMPPKVDPVTGNIAGWVKTFREAENKRRRAPEAQPRAMCKSTCCGTLGARMRDGSCWGCR